MKHYIFILSNIFSASGVVIAFLQIATPSLLESYYFFRGHVFFYFTFEAIQDSTIRKNCEKKRDLGRTRAEDSSKQKKKKAGRGRASIFHALQMQTRLDTGKKSKQASQHASPPLRLFKRLYSPLIAKWPQIERDYIEGPSFSLQNFFP